MELARAEKAAATAADELAAAEQAVESLESDVATLGRDAYMADDRFGGVAVLLDSESPGEVLQRAATLDLLGEDRVVLHRRGPVRPEPGRVNLVPIGLVDELEERTAAEVARDRSTQEDGSPEDRAQDVPGAPEPPD